MRIVINLLVMVGMLSTSTVACQQKVQHLPSALPLQTQPSDPVDMRIFQHYKVDGKNLICSDPAPFFVFEIEWRRFIKECRTCSDWKKPELKQGEK